MQKDFDEWNKVKKIINSRNNTTGAHPREIWWAALGVNVGSEQDGHGERSERPVLIIKKVSPNVVYVLPLSTKEKSAVSQIAVRHEETKGFALLDQMRALDKKRLLRKVGTIDTADFVAIQARLIAFLQS